MEALGPEARAKRTPDFPVHFPLLPLLAKELGDF